MKNIQKIGIGFLFLWVMSCTQDATPPNILAKFYGKWRISIAEVNGVNISGQLSKMRFELPANQQKALATSSIGQVYEAAWSFDNKENLLKVELVLGTLLRDNIFVLTETVINEQEGTITGKCRNTAKNIDNLPDEWKDFLKQYDNATIILRKE